MTPARGKVVVRPVETPETLAGGKILLTEKTREAMTSHQMEVVAVGLAAHCDDADCERQHVYEGATRLPGANIWHLDGALHPCGIQPHEWVLVAYRSLSETDTDGIFICSQDDVLAL